uniref:F-box associated domain-containing protein n=1 Tax=Aegilops tauschii subsp. strangulata TaxID=200361 RepID=A0A453GG17_AEGTS
VDNRYADNGCSRRVQIATPSEVGGASWGPVMKYFHIGLPSEGLQYNRDANVVHGGVIHFPMLTYNNEMILTYNVHTEKVGTVKLPHINSKASQRHLGTSPDGMLRLLIADGFKISVWLQLIGGDWTLETVIDTEKKLRSPDPDIPSGHAMIEFMDEPGEKSGPVLLRIRHPDMWLHDDELPIMDVGDGGPLINFDLGTKEMHRQSPVSSLAVLLEIDMVSHLQSMRIFS